MKVTKLVLGILSIVFCVIVLLQSCAAGTANTLLENNESGGSGGFLVFALMLAGGIVMIAARKGAGIGGSVTGIVLYGVAALVGFLTAGSFKALYLWAAFCTLMLIFNIIALIVKVKGNGDSY